MFSKNAELCIKRKTIFFSSKESPRLLQLNVAMAHRNYFRCNSPQIGNIYTKIEDL